MLFGADSLFYLDFPSPWFSADSRAEKQNSGWCRLSPARALVCCTLGVRCVVRFYFIENGSHIQGTFVQRVDNAIHQINQYPAASVACFVDTYPLDRDFEQLGNGYWRIVGE